MSLTQFFKYYIINKYLYWFFKCNNNVNKIIWTTQLKEFMSLI